MTTIATLDTRSLAGCIEVLMAAALDVLAERWPDTFAGRVLKGTSRNLLDRNAELFARDDGRGSPGRTPAKKSAARSRKRKR